MDHNTTGSDSNIVQIGDFARDVPFTSTQPEFIDISEEPTGHSTPASTPRTPGHLFATPSSSGELSRRKILFDLRRLGIENDNNSFF